MQQSLLDDLGKAIDRLMERCQALDTDRTKLARALARVQEELVRERAAYADLREYCGRLKTRQEEAANRLEGLLVAILPEGISCPPAEEKQPADASALPASSGALPDAGNARDPLAQPRVKPFDIASLERIAGLAAAAVGELRSAPPALPPAEEAASLDEGARVRTASEHTASERTTGEHTTGERATSEHTASTPTTSERAVDESDAVTTYQDRLF